MSTLVLRCCPNCRRNVAAQALVCRACYTVLPRKKKEEPVLATAPQHLYMAPVRITLLVAIVAGLWWARVDLGLVPPEGSEQGANLAGARFLFSSGGSNAAITSSNQTATHWSIIKEDGKCILTQGVRNVGAVPATHAAFRVQFQDPEGYAIGDSAHIEKRIAIPPGREERIELVAPCPKAAVGAQVAILESTTATKSEPKLELLARRFTANQSLSSKNVSAILVEVADLSICTPPGNCMLKVTFGEDVEASYWFQRDQHSPELLLNENSILIGYLQTKRPATLHLDRDLNGTTIPLTYKNVQEEEPPGYLERLWDLMPWPSGDKS